LLLDEVKPGAVRYQLQLTGFKPTEVSGEVRPNEQTFLAARLEKKLSAMRGAVWQNSLGIRFVPVGNWHISAWETRLRDWTAFCAATNRRPSPPDFKQGETDPVVRVNWRDAMDFCQWLTEKGGESLDETDTYRLPTDQEWSRRRVCPARRHSPEEGRTNSRSISLGRQWPRPTARATMRWSRVAGWVHRYCARRQLSAQFVRHL
jgi:hypothetical protein